MNIPIRINPLLYFLLMMLISYHSNAVTKSINYSETNPVFERISKLDSEIKTLKAAYLVARSASSLSEAGTLEVEARLEEMFSYRTMITSKEGYELLTSRLKIEEFTGFVYQYSGKSIEETLRDYKPERGTTAYNDLTFQLLQKQAEIEIAFFKGDATKLEILIPEAKEIKTKLDKYVAKSTLSPVNSKQGLVLIKNDNGLPAYWFTGDPDIDILNYKNAKALNN